MNRQNENKPIKYAAVVLAADRTATDPITQHTGGACKVFAEVGGVPMIMRVLDALAASDQIGRIVLCGPPETRLDDCLPLRQRIKSGEITWLPNKDSPSRSAEHGINYLPDDMPVLLTTADHALLSPQIVQYFLTESSKAESDATVGMVTDAQMSAAFPGIKRTVFRLQDGGFSGCNLFTFKPQGRKLVNFWRQVEDLRKKPWRIVAQLASPGLIFSFLLRRLSLKMALDALAERSGVKIKAVLLPDARAGIDVDTVEDLRLAESLVNHKPVPRFERNKII